jgi:PPK2 family polyphosphate:nucleotide phosphotransferase
MEQYRVKPDQKIKLKQVDPGDTSECPGGKGEAKPEIARLTRKLDQLQQLLFAQHEHKLLVVLQGMDTAGKDGTIKHVFAGVDPEGVRVVNFKQPTPEEQDHDFLWRIHTQAPGSGELVIFNRSHYEDVLIVRVHQLVAEKVWKRRYAEINHFEQLLSKSGTTILKFFLHISKATQKTRLEERLETADKQWKFNPEDLKERDLWPDYMQAYEDALNKTSTPWAPWILVPADHKWYRDLVVAHFMVKALEDLKMTFPKPTFDPTQIKVE